MKKSAKRTWIGELAGTQPLSSETLGKRMSR
jgi:hypothetical protein